MTSGVPVVTEAVILWTEKVLGPETLSPTAEADDNRGTLVFSMLSAAERGSGEEKGCPMFIRVSSSLFLPQPSGVPVGVDSSTEEDGSSNNRSVFPGVCAPAVLGSDEMMDFGTFFFETVKSVLVSVDAGIAAGSCSVSWMLPGLLSSIPGISVRSVYLSVSGPSVVSARCVSVDASLAKGPSVELVLSKLNSGTILSVEEFLEGVRFAWGLEEGLVLCSEFVISREVDSGRAEYVIAKDWVASP